MPTDKANRRYRFVFVLVLTLVVLGVFIAVIRAFILDILMAAMFAGLLDPAFKRILRFCNGSRTLAAALVLILTLLVFALPIIAFVSIAGAQALQLSEATLHWVQYTVDHPKQFMRMVPNWLVPDSWLRAMIASLTSGASDVVRALSGFLTKSISAVTQGAISFFVDLFVIFYAMFYFLRHGAEVLDAVLDQLPLAKDEGHAVADKVLLVTSATLKSVVIIGLIQGALMGMAFTVVGIGQPLFWAAVTVVVSAVPSVGPKIVWVPAAIYLFATGETVYAVGLIVWGLAVVDVVDNVVRPFIVGRDTAMPDFLVLITTLGGLLVFGVPGILLGPVLGAVLLGVLELYQSVMRSTGLSNDAE